MSIKLPREFLWQDYKSMDEFLKEPINQDLYKVYLSVKDAPYKITMPDVKVFNELYYQCVKFYLGDVSMSDIANSIEADLGFVYSKNLITSMMYAVIVSQKKRIDNYYDIIYFLLDSRGWYQKTFSDFVVQNQAIYKTNINPRPIDVETAVTLVDNWFETTFYYSQRVIEKIVNLWKSKEERLFVLSIIEESFKIIMDKECTLPIKGADKEDDTADTAFFVSLRKRIERSIKIPSNGKNYSYNNKVIKSKVPNIFLPSSSNTSIKSEGDKSLFWQAILKAEKGEQIINLLHKRIDGKKKALDIVMPFHAAIKAKVIRRPSWTEYKSEFSDDYCKKSSFTRLTNETENPYKGHTAALDELKKEFEAI
jgi:hypothetical protein